MLLFMRTRPPLSLQLELLVSDGHNANLGIAMGVQSFLVPEIDVDGVTSQPESQLMCNLQPPKEPWPLTCTPEYTPSWE